MKDRPLVIKKEDTVSTSFEELMKTGYIMGIDPYTEEIPLKSDPNVSVSCRVIDFSDAEEGKQISPILVVPLCDKPEIKKLQMEYNLEWERQNNLLLKKAELNQTSTAREFPRMNDIYQEQVLKPKNDE